MNNDQVNETRLQVIIEIHSEGLNFLKKYITPCCEQTYSIVLPIRSSLEILFPQPLCEL